MTYRLKIGIREQNEAYTVCAMANFPENTPRQKDGIAEPRRHSHVP